MPLTLQHNVHSAVMCSFHIVRQQDRVSHRDGPRHTKIHTDGQEDGEAAVIE